MQLGEVRKDVLEHFISQDDSLRTPRSIQIRVPPGNLFVERNDRNIEVRRWIGFHPAKQACTFGFNPVLQNDEVVGVEEEHGDAALCLLFRGRAVGLPDLTAKPDHLLEIGVFRH